MCTKDLKEHLELSTREMNYKQVRDEIISYAGAMDVDEVEDDHVWWGGMEHDHEQCWYSMGWNKGIDKGGYKGYPKGGSKGSLNDFKSVGKGDYSKGSSKGDGKEKEARAAALSIALSSEGRLHGEPAEEREGQLQGWLRADRPQRRKEQVPVREFGEIWGLSLLVLLGTSWQSLCCIEPVRRLALAPLRD